MTRSRYVSALLQHRVAAGIEHEAVLLSIRPEFVVDVGANRGQFSLAVRSCAPTASIVAFEPLPVPASTYREIFHSDRRVTLHEAAISQRIDTATIHVSTRDDSSSLLPIAERQVQLFPGTQEAGLTEVRTTRLDAVVTAQAIVKPSLLKLDVQGYELEALEGCSGLIDFFDFVYVECSFIELYRGQHLAHDVLDWLRSKAFILAGVYNVTCSPDGVSVQADFLFRRCNGG